MFLITIAGLWKAGQFPLQISALLNLSLSAANQAASAFQASSLPELFPAAAPVDTTNRPVTATIYDPAASVPTLPIAFPQSFIQPDPPPHTFSPAAVSAIEQAAIDYQLFTNPPATEVRQPGL